MAILQDIVHEGVNKDVSITIPSIVATEQDNNTAELLAYDKENAADTGTTLASITITGVTLNFADSNISALSDGVYELEAWANLDDANVANYCLFPDDDDIYLLYVKDRRAV